jgi:exonuclease III
MPITFTHPLNIRDGRNSCLAIAIREFQQGNYDIVVATETKIPDEVYTKHTLGYEVTCSRALPNQGGVALITRANPEGWHIESTRFHGPNVLSCIINSGDKRMPLIGAYLPASSLDSLPDFEEALNRFNGFTNIVVAGDFNADIHDLTKPRNQTISACFAA